MYVSQPRSTLVPRLAATLAAVVLLVSGAPATPDDAFAAHSSTAVLPDLGMLPPRDFSVTNRPRGVRWLRFDTIVVNDGPGVLDIYGSNDGASVTQRIRDSSALGGWSEHPIPATMFYAGDGHDHWHVNEFQLWELASATAPASALRRGAKTGFCFWDNYDYSATNGSAYYHPDRTSACELDGNGRIPMGLSVDWGDEYPSNIAFQYIDVTKLAYGDYIVTLTADPKGEVIEALDTNNRACARIRISRSGVRVLEQDTDLDGTPADCSP